MRPAASSRDARAAKVAGRAARPGRGLVDPGGVRPAGMTGPGLPTRAEACYEPRVSAVGDS